MSDKDLESLREKGVVIIKTIHAIFTMAVMILVFVVSLFVQKALTEKAVDMHESRIKELETSERVDTKILQRMEFNLKNLCEKNKVNYIE
jgi:hypothetical protein